LTVPPEQRRGCPRAAGLAGLGWVGQAGLTSGCLPMPAVPQNSLRRSARTGAGSCTRPGPGQTCDRVGMWRGEAPFRRPAACSSHSEPPECCLAGGALSKPLYRAALSGPGSAHLEPLRPPRHAHCASFLVPKPARAGPWAELRPCATSHDVTATTQAGVVKRALGTAQLKQALTCYVNDSGRAMSGPSQPRDAGP